MEIMVFTEHMYKLLMLLPLEFKTAVGTQAVQLLMTAVSPVCLRPALK